MSVTTMTNKRGYDTTHPKYLERTEERNFVICDRCGYRFASGKKIPRCGKCGSYKTR